MFLKHVLRTFKSQWLSGLLLGILLIISGFIYLTMTLSIEAIKEESDSFFATSNQEDFSLETTIYVTEEDKTALENTCTVDLNSMLSSLQSTNLSCYETLLDNRQKILEETYLDADFEVRRYKDSFIEHENTRNRVRFLHSTDTINLSYIVKGNTPQSHEEIAINELYATHHNIAIGDPVLIRETTFTVSGFVLFPDYNLPILDNPYLFDGTNQTLALVTDQAFLLLSQKEHHYLTGVYHNVIDNFETTIYEFDFINRYIATENNARSGAIYAELAGGQSIGLTLSVVIAGIGMIIVGIMVSKTMSNERRPLGVLKALGVNTKEMILPYVCVMTIFSLIFLSIGAFLGYLTAPWMQNLYLRFYLLPKGPITLSIIDILIAILAPTIIVVLLTVWRLKKLVQPKVKQLIEPRLMKKPPSKKPWIKKFIKRFNLLNILQGSLLIRQWGKVMVYSVGLFFAIFLVFMSLGMRDIFSLTMESYYQKHTYDSVIYCEADSDCDPQAFDRGIELNIIADNERATLLALDKDNSTHPLTNKHNEDLNHKLDQGIIISQSFQDLTRIEKGDYITVTILQETYTLPVVGVADMYPGAYLFYDRDLVSEFITGDENYFNRLYADEPIDEDAYPLVVYREDIINQVTTINEAYAFMMYILVFASAMMAFIIIYLITILTVESKYYELSLFKVIGFNHKEISKVLLGGYFKLNMIIFIISIPVIYYTFVMMRYIMISMYGMYFPIYMTLGDGLLAFIILIIVSSIAKMHAKSNVKQHSLQEALKIYQV